MAGLTKQHFKEIAKIINKDIFGSYDIEQENPLKMFLEDLSKYFKEQNPLFNENRFKKACLE